MICRIALTALLLSLLACAQAPTAAKMVKIADLPTNPNYEDISKIPGVRVDMRYTTSSNFVGKPLYGNFKTCYLHRDAAAKLREAYRLLQLEKPGWGFIVTDGLRPVSMSQMMWDTVKDTPNRIYVADPQKGSVHNYGLAVDISLLDSKGQEVDMGTPIDGFDELSQPKLEEQFLKNGRLSKNQYQNRLLLRNAMTKAGFVTISTEWWHFNLYQIEDIPAKYPKVN